MHATRWRRRLPVDESTSGSTVDDSDFVGHFVAAAKVLSPAGRKKLLVIFIHRKCKTKLWSSKQCLRKTRAIHYTTKTAKSNHNVTRHAYFGEDLWRVLLWRIASNFRLLTCYYNILALLCECTTTRSYCRKKTAKLSGTIIEHCGRDCLQWTVTSQTQFWRPSAAFFHFDCWEFWQFLISAHTLKIFIRHKEVREETTVIIIESKQKQTIQCLCECNNDKLFYLFIYYRHRTRTRSFKIN